MRHPTSHTGVLLAAMLCGGLLTPEQGNSEPVGQIPNAQFVLHLDDATYLENQPIRALLELENPRGGGTLARVPSLDPIGTEVTLSLETSTGKRIPRSGYSAYEVRSGRQDSLKGGESTFRGINILDWFGYFDHRRGEVGWKIGQLYLPPGEYLLSASLNGLTGARGESGTVRTLTKRFTIVRASEHPKDLAFVEEMLGGASSGDKFPTRQLRAQNALDRAIVSKYAFFVLGLAGEMADSERLRAIQLFQASDNGRQREPFVVELFMRLAPHSELRQQLEALVSTRPASDLTRRILDDASRKANAREQ